MKNRNVENRYRETEINEGENMQYHVEEWLRKQLRAGGAAGRSRWRNQAGMSRRRALYRYETRLGISEIQQRKGSAYLAARRESTC